MEFYTTTSLLQINKLKLYIKYAIVFNFQTQEVNSNLILVRDFYI